ncbi:MAG: hypothetical protein LIO91_03570 [Bacteroidales bacterium]|nr:hypothetical protein [Bacteroidales bacterium]
MTKEIEIKIANASDDAYARIAIRDGKCPDYRSHTDGFHAGVDWLAQRLAAMPSARLRAELEQLTINH